MKGLTLKQRQLLDFIHTFIQEHHYSPSYHEIMRHFAFKSPGSVYKYIQTLIRKGVLVSEKNAHRSIIPVKETPLAAESVDSVHLPLIGNLSAGYPLELFAQHRLLAVPLSLVHHPEDTYILQVQGNALEEESILSGDFLLIETRQDIQAGEIILGLINQHDSILKRYFPEGQSVRLESQHSQHSSFTVRNEHILIQGVLIGMFRVF